METPDIRLLIVDDHQVLIDGIRALLDRTPGIDIRHEAHSGRAALDLLGQKQDIDLVLLDINLPDINGFEVCQTIRERHPNVRVLTLTMHQEPGFIGKMVRAGTDGYLLKSTGKEELINAIRAIARGEKYFGREVTDSLLEGLQTKKKTKPSAIIEKITRREKEVLKLIIEENNTEEIAQKLFISETTVISHRKSLLRKLNVKNTAGLVRAAYEFNLLD